MQKLTNKTYNDWLTKGTKEQKKLAKDLKSAGLVSEGRKEHYSQDMWDKETEIMKVAQSDGKYYSYENKNGVKYECRFYFRKATK